MKWSYKLKGSALQYVLIIAVVVALILTAFISLIYVQDKLKIKNNFYKTTINNAQNAFEVFALKDFPYGESSLTFENNSLEDIKITKKSWGLFDLGIVTSSIKNETFTKVGLLGKQKNAKDALYVQETFKPLMVVGKTYIKGNAFLPKQGVKSGYIGGESYYGTSLIYGNQKQSSERLPKIKNFNKVEEILTNKFNSEYEFIDIGTENKITQSFLEPTLKYTNTASINLEGYELKGNIIIESKSKIIVASSSVLNDVLLIAPQIEIEANVNGNFQSIASKEIKVGENVVLEYPSALVLYDKDTSKNEVDSKIEIAKETEIRGVVAYITKNKELTYNSQVILQESSLVKGEIYCNKNLELLGSVEGAVYTNNFLTRKQGSLFINHLYNVEINAAKLPKQYCGLQLDSSKLKVMKWLY